MITTTTYTLRIFQEGLSVADDRDDSRNPPDPRVVTIESVGQSREEFLAAVAQFARLLLSEVAAERR